MRIFETYPPSSVLAALVAAGAVLIGGLSLAAPLLVGIGAMALGHRLDLYGIHRGR